MLTGREHFHSASQSRGYKTHATTSEQQREIPNDDNTLRIRVRVRVRVEGIAGNVGVGVVGRSSRGRDRVAERGEVDAREDRVREANEREGREARRGALGARVRGRVAGGLSLPLPFSLPVSSGVARLQLPAGGRGDRLEFGDERAVGRAIQLVERATRVRCATRAMLRGAHVVEEVGVDRVARCSTRLVQLPERVMGILCCI